MVRCKLDAANVNWCWRCCSQWNFVKIKIQVVHSIELLYTVNYLYFNFYDIPLTTTASASIYIGGVELASNRQVRRRTAAKSLNSASWKVYHTCSAPRATCLKFYQIRLNTTASTAFLVGVVKLPIPNTTIFFNTRRGVPLKLLLLRRRITAVGTNVDQRH